MNKYITGLFLAALLALPGVSRADDMKPASTTGDVPAATEKPKTVTTHSTTHSSTTHKKKAKKDAAGTNAAGSNAAGMNNAAGSEKK